MPKEQMNEQQVAAYLHLDVREVTKLASRGRIPCHKAGGRLRFFKGELDHWVESQMHALGKERLSGIEKGVSAHHGFDPALLVVCPLIPPKGIAAPLHARTRDSVLRELVGLADAAGRVYARDDLVNEVRRREEMCPTAMIPGVAIPHPRHPLPYDIDASFVVVGLTPSGIPYGAADGSLTRLFFLICCKDERTHLHVLSRLALMLHEGSAVEEMLAAETPDQLSEVLNRREQEVVSKDQ